MKVLLAVDSCDSQVIHRATKGPWPLGTLFCVMSVVDLRQWQGMPELIEDAKQAAESVVQCATGKLTECGYKAFPEMRIGFPKEIIVGFAKQWGAELIMVGSHGHGGITRFLLGSIAQSILRNAHCAVEIVRPAPEVSTSGQGTKILLATDGSECSVKAVHFVAHHLWPAHSEVRILSVAELVSVQVPTLASQFCAPAPALIDKIYKQASKRAEESVADARKILIATGLDLCDAMPMGEPRSLILDEARACSSDLIVLGSHGRHGLARFLVGSVAETVAAHARCSVAVVR